MMKPEPSIAGDKETALHDPSYPGSVALAIEGVSHCYGTCQALDNVSFTVAPGSFTALLGLNGAGKSTLFSIITRLFGVQAGRIGIFGHDIGREPGEALRCMGSGRRARHRRAMGHAPVRRNRAQRRSRYSAPGPNSRRR